MKIKNLSALLFIGICCWSITSCVPARKFEELEAKEKECSEKLSETTKRMQDLEVKNKELEAELTELKKANTKLETDTTLLGKSLRLKEQQYDKIHELNLTIQRQLEKLQAGSEAENRRIMAELEAARLDLQRREDELRVLAKELDMKEQALIDREKRVKELEELIAQKDEAVRALKDKVKAALTGFEGKGITVEQRNGRVYVSMEAKLLFASGSADVGTEGKKAVTQLATALEGLEDMTILVEGHTDADKIRGGKYKDNWDLSTARATSVVRLMVESSDINPINLTAAGRGEFMPIESNDTDEGKAKNRRIEVILTPDLDKLFEILEVPENE